MSTVTLTLENAIAVITVNNPPINATSHVVRSGIVDALDQIDANDDIRAAILICDGKTFIAGADVSEFGQPPKAPILPDVIKRIEAATKPVIAAIHGHALGGGLEVALGCHYRIADSTAKLGLPEVNLGLIPGAGGTVRLPRLVPVAEAISMITSGKPVSATKANEIGLLDAITHGALGDAARDFAKTILSRETPASLLARDPIAAPSSAQWDDITSATKKKARGQVAPLAAISAIRNGIEHGPDAGLDFEREKFIELRDSDQSKALRHIFFAERSVAKLPELKGVEPNPIRQVGVIGGGIMGAGIATASLLAGFDVTIIERDEAACDNGRATVEKHLAGSLKRGLISQDRFDALMASFSTSIDYAALSDADLVVEAVFEDMAVKHDVFGKLGLHCKADAVLASNTSYLDINEIAARSVNPRRVIGLHFFSPAHIMKLLEVVRTDKADAKSLATAFEFARALGKIAVPCGVCDGFIGNRIMSAYRKHCEYMLEDGALPHQIDAAMVEFGFPMGLFAMQDMAGLEISWATRKRLAPFRDPSERYVALGDYLCEMGRFGKKNGLGWYRYDEHGKAQPDPEVDALVIAESEKKGITRRDFTSTEIMNVILTAMRNEGDKIMSEGIATSADAIDVVMVNGYGFPRHKGGPIFMTVSD
ncbi:MULTISPECIES: 3-hydroxyacyl-CoA dehydrogenase NAD-binding domain-containing protein [unclassified Thalassospira]|uniref:3-hydroxyacyl-CoA dehydrogenase NAD-binding domain-containing protein n=1 Tax=unclassified Thalassospira TaxID=2648997 RepID=UPI0018CEE780|nr:MULTISPECIES: 3-hydroxyacyl-CoA dehydrogenase NAD-binding domain-containing protein [unclassified Thalassospira]QPO10772.1 enoyl-CoA hydratase/isomerase family protein [Thalassospira sp. A40-3]|tara:strand:- start:1222 stop:3180 length:1959 start_codon:yes stop_codon:yes gene_type:complete